MAGQDAGAFECAQPWPGQALTRGRGDAIMNSFVSPFSVRMVMKLFRQ